MKLQFLKCINAVRLPNGIQVLMTPGRYYVCFKRLESKDIKEPSYWVLNDQGFIDPYLQRRFEKL